MTLLEKKLFLAKSLKSSLALIESDIKKLKSRKVRVKRTVKLSEPVKLLSERSRNFVRDDARTLINKFKNVKYADYKNEIYALIKKRCDRSKPKQQSIYKEVL